MLKYTFYSVYINVCIVIFQAQSERKRLLSEPVMNQSIWCVSMKCGKKMECPSEELQSCVASHLLHYTRGPQPAEIRINRDVLIIGC